MPMNREDVFSSNPEHVEMVFDGRRLMIFQNRSVGVG